MEMKDYKGIKLFRVKTTHVRFTFQISSQNPMGLYHVIRSNLQIRATASADVLGNKTDLKE